ncbi:MAG TPA: ABC transporter ATP-binding protein [Myxococcota bacterium]|nr:ABC transporter ATP-binding protein [Myxococcota bacterium]
MSELEAVGVVKRFQLGEEIIEVLSGVNLLLRPGESLAVLGVSGAGKSTLLHVLGGLERPSAGSVRFGGRDLYGLPPEEVAAFRNRSLGFVFQSHHLLPEFDAEENVMMPCLLAGLSRRQAREKARALLDAVGLSHRLRHGPGKLSGGERQRVAIARALVMDPAVVLADEPTGNLDPHTADEVVDLFLRLNGQAQTALVLVTHNEKLANRLAKKCYLVEGRLAS